MSFSDQDYLLAQTGGVAGGGLSLRCTQPDAPPVPRVVTTGGKKTTTAKVIENYFDTGERIAIVALRGKPAFLRHIDPLVSVSSDVAFIDALAFSVLPPDEKSYPWVLEQMRQFMPIEGIEFRGGLFGFKYSARLNGGHAVIAWGGESQRGRVYFSLMGQGCSVISNWANLRAWLEKHRATIKRVDCAHDDIEGKQFNIDWAVDQYKGEGFNAGGRKPRHECNGDWLDGSNSIKGRTFYIGSRNSGKITRVYEKGKQLGDPASPWTRIEVEWRDQDRYIPYDILTNPGQYLAGAYPCLSILSKVQSVIKTVTKAIQVSYDCAVENAKQHCGKTVNLMLQVLGGDYVEVVKQLAREGLPARVDPYSYHVHQDPTMFDPQLRGSPA